MGIGARYSRHAARLNGSAGVDPGGHRMDKIRPSAFDCGHQVLEMPGKPQIVMPEVGDVPAASSPQPFIVRAALRAEMTGQVDPIQAPVTKAGDHLATMVSARIADN